MLSVPKGVTLYFARHGQTEANVEDRFSGKKDTPLTEKGRAQARQVGLILERLLAADRPAAPLHYVASVLRRAQISMEIARAAMGLPPQGYDLEPRIQEIDLGAWDQLSVAEARALDPAFFDRRTADKWNIPAPGGEDYAQVAARCESWVGDLKTDTFAISHGAFTRVLRGLLLGLDAAQISALDEPQGVVFRVRGRTVERFDP